MKFIVYDTQTKRSNYEFCEKKISPYWFISRFSAAYKNKFKISPVNDLINARIIKAKSLLIVGGFSISTVSEMVGFTSIYYFSKYFKAKEGVSPSEFIKRNV